MRDEYLLTKSIMFETLHTMLVILSVRFGMNIPWYDKKKIIFSVKTNNKYLNVK